MTVRTREGADPCFDVNGVTLSEQSSGVISFFGSQ